MNKQRIYNEINTLWRDFIEIRATYPYARENQIGSKTISSAPYYIKQGYNYKLEFDHILDENDIQTIRRLGNWINQSALIRLYAILDHYKIISNNIKIKLHLDGCEEMDILRRLRNRFAHGGEYNPNIKDDKKLFDRLVGHFSLTISHPEIFPIPIDKVIEPIFNKVKTYIDQL